jgi:DNA-binding transcriptional regulator YbjK
MRQLLDAAMRVVAEQGMRGLTHRAVDREAGLPEGSCSAYLRTRKALVLALTRYVADSATADVERLASQLEHCEPADDRAVELVTTFLMGWIDQRERLVARMELTLEATRDPDVAALLGDSRVRLLGLVEAILAGRSEEHTAVRAATLVASFDGVLLGALPRPPRERRPFVRHSLEALLGGLG